MILSHTIRRSFGVTALIGLVGLTQGCGSDATATSRTRRPASIVTAIAEGAREGFARVRGPRPLSFPRDHGPHPDHQLEWWYFTGNLADEAGAEYGFQLTFFRTGLRAEIPERSSAWAARESYMAHFALGEVETGRFHAFDRFARAALDLAGAQATPFRVWTEGWSAASEGSDLLPMRLRAAEDGIALDLRLDPGKPLLLQGDRGYSAKGPEPGNASMYLSFTRLPARGTLRIGGLEIAVRGHAWMDHEWSTSVLGPELGGWDWFAIQLRDGRDLMLYYLRGKDGSAGAFSSGVIVDAEGAARKLALAEFSIIVLDHWESSETGARYPARWRLRVPSANLDLEIVPKIADQELRIAVTYWEGAVVALDTAGTRVGQGFVELVGYAEAAAR
jgi:predicted secreted hydrolase